MSLHIHLSLDGSKGYGSRKVSPTECPDIHQTDMLRGNDVVEWSLEDRLPNTYV
jgi:hypothetical protein